MSKIIKKAPINSAKTCPKLIKTQNVMTGIVVVSLLQNLFKSHTKANVSNIYLEQTSACTVDVQLIFKKAMRNKKAYTKCKSVKKYPRKT